MAKYNDVKGVFVLTTKKCPICKKTFSMEDADAWVYKLRLNASQSQVSHLCSWTCFRKAEQMRKGRNYRAYK